jgi:hypothetical protein
VIGRDPVDPELRIRIIHQDGGCLAPRLDPGAGLCAGRLTLDHVKDQPKVGDPVVKRGPERRRRYRAPSDRRHLATLCHHHHLDGWATSHRGLLRDYLAGLRG